MNDARDVRSPISLFPSMRYWTSVKNEDDEDMRPYLPNYFNTFREALRGNPLYADLIGNRGTVLEMLGPGEEALEHFSEAEEFARLS